MKLRARLVRTSKTSGKKFYRHDLPIPQKAIEALGWTPSTRLKAEVKGDTLVIRRA